MTGKSVIIASLMILILMTSAACASGPNSTPALTVTPIPTPTSAPSPSHSQYQLEYQLLAKYPDFFWCDPDFYPISREGQEQVNALLQFPVIQANTTEFPAILEHLNLANKADFNDAEKLSIYREHKKLTRAITITPSGNIYSFSVRVGQNQGQLIEGTITPVGQITVLKTETSFNTCPICLTSGTLIDTPSGPVTVEGLRPGIYVWTLDRSGNRVAVPVIRTSSTPLAPSFLIVKVSLNDGRAVMASPGHPTGEMRPLGDYRVGDILDGSVVISVELVAYTVGATYDVLPAGDTGFYWANGILLGSTLASGE